MEYILFASFALIASAGNTIFNRLGSNHSSALINSTLKSFFIVFACFFIVLGSGHITELYTLSVENWLWLLLIGALTAIDWVFYFLAIKRSHLEAFAPMCAASMLFFANSLFLIFTFGLVTNGGKTLNIILYSVGLLSLLGSLFFIVFNKKVNPSKKWLWVLFTIIAVVALGFVQLIVKTKLSDVAASVISFHQMMIVFAVTLIASLLTKTIKEVVHIKPIEHLYIFLGSVCNALMLVFRYVAYSSPNSIPAIVNVIIGLDFVLVSVATIIFFKAKNKLQLGIIIAFVVAGMVLDVLAGLL